MTDDQKTLQKTKQFNQKRKKIVEKLEEKGNQNLAENIKQSTRNKLANQDIIQAWKQVFPENKDLLIAIQKAAKDPDEKNSTSQTYDPNRYFERNGNGRLTFKPDRMARHIEENYRFKYVEETGKFWVYQDNYWQDRAERVIKEEVNTRLNSEYEPSYASKTVDTIKNRENISVDTKKKFQPAENKIPFKNCVYNIKTEQIEAHKPENHFTHIIPWNYNPDAQCPRINKFLDTILDSERDKETILETIGYSMLADYPYGHALLLHGKGKNGKSVLLNLWKHLLGGKNYKEEQLQQLEETRFATQSIYRKLAVFNDDLPSKKLESGSTLKAMTGGGEVRAEIKGGKHFQFENFATPVFACNEIPESSDDSDGFYRRWEIVNFPFKFVDNPKRNMDKQKKDKTLLMEELKQESEIEGLINEAVVRLVLMKKQSGFTFKTDAEDTRSLWKSYSNPFQQFLELCLDQGMTQEDAKELDTDRVDADLSEYDYDFIVKEDLVWLIDKYCEYYGSKAPTKTTITRELKNHSPYFVRTGRTRQLGSDQGVRTPVYKYLRFSDEFEKFIESDEKRPECPYFFANLRGCANKVKRSKRKTPDTVDTLDLGEEEILEFVTDQSENSGGVSVSDLVDEFSDRDGVGREDVEDKIRGLEKVGALFKPEPGMVEKL